MTLLATGGALAGMIAAAGFINAPAALPSVAARAPVAVQLVRDPASCARLTGMKLDSGVVDGAERFAAGETITGGTTIGAKAAVDLCRVRLSLSPAPGSDIKVEVWLPERWNERLMGFGGGGFDGSLNKDSGQFLNRATGQGYAAVATDAGHTPAPTPGSWIHDQPEKVIDFGHRAVHLAAVTAKQVLTAYYGAPAQRALFQGCSNGGRDALMLVSRHPDDYDAVVAGAPAIRYLEVVTQLVWYSRAAASVPKLASKLDMVHSAILKKCDALDGVKDGVLENPQACRFDPAALQCKAGDAPGCLTGAELGALRKIYGGPRLSNGRQIYSGPAFGSEGVPGNWSAWVTGPVPAIAGEEFYRWMVHDDPAWKLPNFDLDRDYALARTRIAPIINVENPDISAFTKRGGKLIIYQGWDDPAITPGGTLDYYEAIRRSIGPKAADRHVRLFMVPGMMHCGGGPGATSFDMQAELERWVDTGKPPERVIASKPDVPKGEPPLTRPLCAWPNTAHYNGSGSTRDAANFTCKRPR